jgi:hypothetical protein
MNARALTTIIGWVGWWVAWRKLWAMEVASQFPGFHATHGYTHEILAMLAMAVIWSVTWYHLWARRATSEIQDTIKS